MASVSADLLSLLIVGVVVAGGEGVGPHQDAPLYLVAEGALIISGKQTFVVWQVLKPTGSRSTVRFKQV